MAGLGRALLRACCFAAAAAASVGLEGHLLRPSPLSPAGVGRKVCLPRLRGGGGGLCEMAQQGGGTLYLIGLGLGDEKDITVKGLETVRRCKVILPVHKPRTYLSLSCSSSLSPHYLRCEGMRACPSAYGR